MSKLYMLVGLCLVITGLGINYIFGYDKDVEESDYNIAMTHAEVLYGANDDNNLDVIVCDDTDDEMIHYECYKDSEMIDDVRIYRDIAFDCLTGGYEDVHD